MKDHEALNLCCVVALFLRKGQFFVSILFWPALCYRLTPAVSLGVQQTSCDGGVAKRKNQEAQRRKKQVTRKVKFKLLHNSSKLLVILDNFTNVLDDQRIFTRLFRIFKFFCFALQRKATNIFILTSLVTS